MEQLIRSAGGEIVGIETFKNSNATLWIMDEEKDKNVLIYYILRCILII